MNTTDSQAPQDLDTRIATVEARLVARQEQLRLQWDGLRERVEHAAQPRKLILPAAVATVSLLALWSLFHRSSGSGSPGHAPSSSRHGVSLWTRLLRWTPLLLPLLPGQWRARLGPTVSSSLVGLAVPMLRRVWDGRKAGHIHGSGGGSAGIALPQTMAAVDLSRYAGRWHEVARMPVSDENHCATQPIAEYRAAEQGLQVINRCHNARGHERVAHGVARVVPGSGGARLEVSFAPPWLQWLPLVWSDYWILHVDADYDIALAGTPSRDALWLLSRQPELSVDQFRELIGVAREQGYPLRDLRFS